MAGSCLKQQQHAESDQNTRLMIPNRRLGDCRPGGRGHGCAALEWGQARRATRPCPSGGGGGENPNVICFSHVWFAMREHRVRANCRRCPARQPAGCPGRPLRPDDRVRRVRPVLGLRPGKHGQIGAALPALGVAAGMVQWISTGRPNPADQLPAAKPWQPEGLLRWPWRHSPCLLGG